MKTKLFGLIAAFLLTLSAQATCTVTTDCGTYTFEDATSISTSVTSVNGESTLIIKDQNGVELLRLEDCGTSVSASCENSGDGGNGGDGDFDICDVIPDFLKPYFDCE